MLLHALGKSYYWMLYDFFFFSFPYSQNNIVQLQKILRKASRAIRYPGWLSNGMKVNKL